MCECCDCCDGEQSVSYREFAAYQRANERRFAEKEAENEELRERLDDAEAENERLREEKDELAERVDELENQPTVEFRGDDDAREFEDLWIGGQPLGYTMKKNNDRARLLADILVGDDDMEEIERASEATDAPLVGNVDATPARSNTAVRDVASPLHLAWMDVVQGRTEALEDADSFRRGARLYGRALRKDGDSSTDDDLARFWKQNGDRYILTSSGAREILDADGDPDGVIHSQTVKRAMRDAQEKSRPEPDAEPLVEFNTEKPENRLIIEKDALRETMRKLADAQTGGEWSDPDATDDDAEAEAADELERLSTAGREASA